jgi:thiol-disulfide isomerase/thioredoxin
MPSIVDSLYKDFVKKYWFPVFILVLFIIFGYASYYLYNTYYTPKSKMISSGKNVANANRRNNEANLMFFYADWCPHCTNAKPIWEAEKAKYEADGLVNNYKVVFVEINCSDDSDPHVQSAIKEYNIKGFPTVKLVFNKQDGTPMTVDFDAKITKHSLDQFIETSLNRA